MFISHETCNMHLRCKMETSKKATFYTNNVYARKKDIHNIIMSVVHDNYITEEISQAVFEKAWNGLDTLKNRNKSKAWINGIIRNELRAYFRQKNRHIELVKRKRLLTINNEAHKSINEDTLTALLNKETFAALKKSFMQMDSKCREIIELHLIAGISLKNIAKIKGIKYGTLRVMYSRSLKELRKKYLQNVNK